MVTQILDSQKTKICIVVGHNLTDVKVKELELTYQKEETSLFLDIISHDMTNYLCIMNNSMKYDENELVKIEVKLKSDKKKRKNYTISITDHGKGIAPN